MPEAKDQVSVESEKKYEELVDPDVTGDGSSDGAPDNGRPNVGELGPDTTDPGVTNEVDNATKYNQLEEYGNNR